MKKNFTFAVALLLAVIAVSASAQDKSSEKFRIGLGLEGALPTNAGYNYGGGLTLRVAVPIGDASAVTGTTGVMAFIPKSISGVNSKAQLNIPIKAGYEYMFNGTLYGLGEAGFTIARVYIPSATTSSLSSVSSTDFTYSFGVGAHLGAFDPSLRYEGYSSAGFIGLRLGFTF
ncbi:MAG: outer membrane beta-barrel protein [Bacteroidota bacterium]